MTDNTFHADLVAALGALTEVPKAGKVNAGQKRYTFMTLPDLLGHVRTTFAAHHLAIAQHLFTGDTGHTTLETVIYHASGATLSSGGFLFDAGANPQNVGSAVTYYKRYQLAALVGLAGDDDDDGGRAAAHAQEYAQTRPVARQSAQRAEPDPWTTPGAEPPSARPVAPTERPDVGAPTTTTLASEKSRKMMWALLRKTGMDADQIRAWVAAVLTREGDWHTDQLTQFEVSSLIQRLQQEGGDS